MNWTFPPEIEIPSDLLAWAETPLLARLLVQRGLTTVAAARAFTNPNEYRPASPADLPDVNAAVTHLSDAIDRQTPICVWGDFDVDGQTSTALLVSILRQLGAVVRYHVPHRLTEGHGIQAEKLKEELQAGAMLILTCDTGIMAHQAVETVHQAGAKIIITDHHDLGDTLPPADAVINPKRLPADHPLRELPGVGVAFKLAEALTQARGRAPDTEALLDLVALGIVADVATQTGDTRYLLQRGLEVLRHTERPGLLALMDMTNLKPDRLTAEHIGFRLGPRLNALGRLADATQGVELLTTADRGRARILAAQLDALNERRKLLVDRTVVQALGQLADTPALAEYNAIVLSAGDWHPGVIGIACSRLAEQFNRPVILLTGREGLLRGSARSVAGCDIHQAIKSQAALLTSFGGHPMAAGLALPEHHLNDFRRGVSAALTDCVARAKQHIAIDATVTLADIDAALINTLQRLAPFGAGNPPITLAVNDLTVQGEAVFGRARTHRRVTVVDKAGRSAQVIWWNSATSPLPQGLFNLALTVNRDDYRGGDAAQLVWVDAQAQTLPVVPVQRQIIDLRAEADPQFLWDEPDAVFWASEPLSGVRRLTSLGADSAQTKTLVIWQAPPGQDVLRMVLTTVRPEKVYLVARSSALDTFTGFMQHLMGVVKFGLQRYGGRLTIADIALAMVHRETTVRLGLDWLIARGKLRVIVNTDETLVVRADNAPPMTSSDNLQAALQALLNETAAYRAFVQAAWLPALFPGETAHE